MTTTYLRGRDAQKLVSSLAVNSFETFGVERIRHFVACSPDGHYMGDGILASVAPEELVLVGRSAGHNWVRYRAETSGWDVSIEADEIMSANPAGRRTLYRPGGRPPRAGAHRTADRRPSARRAEVAHLSCDHRRPQGLGRAAHDGRQRRM